MQFRVTRPARKHRIGNAHILAAITNAGEPTIEGDAETYIGPDDRGVELRIVVVPDDKRPNAWAVIHAMPTSYEKK